MPRIDVRDLIRKAQSAEIAGDVDEAVTQLRQASQLLLESGDPSRAASLLRHCVRLKADRPDLVALLARAEEAEKDEANAQRAARRTLDEPPRGPVLADPAIEAWCSFCCRPKAEAGPLVAGPAGAFICNVCAATSGALLEGEPIPEAARRTAPVAASQRQPEERTDGVAPAAAAARQGVDFIEAAVILSRELGWGLAEVRSLSEEERDRALSIVERLRPRG